MRKKSTSNFESKNWVPYFGGSIYLSDYLGFYPFQFFLNLFPFYFLILQLFVAATVD